MRTEPRESGRAQSASRPRRYDSELRRRQAQRTRADVLRAAHGLFLERGWAATGMREIATAAGVSVKTIYDAFGSKAELFKTVVDVAVAGDDEPVAVMEREKFADLGRGDLPERVAAGVRLAAEVNRRTADLLRVWRAAADTDPALAAGLSVGIEQQRRTATAGLALMAGRHLDAEQADGLWALTSDEVYRLLVRHAGWSHEQYVRWLTRTTTRLLGLDHPCSGGATTEREHE